MSAGTKIEWTDRTWNPVTGCTKVSPGCDNCYAETFAERFRGVPGHAFERGFDLTLRPERLQDPLRWRKPQRVFVNSMSDLFHKDVPDEFIDRAFLTMCEAERHTFQVLTKRPERMRRFVPWWLDQHGRFYYSGLRNVWLGVSAESDAYRWRIDMLRETPAAMRFVSCEPLIGPLDLRGRLDGVQWVIVGGESGAGARPMHPDWARAVRDACVEAGVAYFFKQWGTWAPRGWKGDGATHALGTGPYEFLKLDHHPDSAERAPDVPKNGRRWQGFARVGKSAAGRELDGRTWDEFPKAVV